MTKLPKRLAFGEIKKRFRAVSPSASLKTTRMQPKFIFEDESDIISVMKIDEEPNLDVEKLDESQNTNSDNSLLFIHR